MSQKPRVRYVTSTGDTSIAYWSFGSGPPVVTVMPTNFSHVQVEVDTTSGWAHYKHLAESVQIVRLDLRNQGLSTRDLTEITTTDLIDDLDAVVRTIDGPITLAALNEMASLALRYAVENPHRVSGLHLHNPLIPLSERPPAAVDPLNELVFRLSRTDWQASLEVVAVLALGLDHAAQAQDFVRVATAASNYADATSLRKAVRALHAEARAILTEVTVPTLVTTLEARYAYSEAVATALTRTIPGAEMTKLGVGGGGWHPAIADATSRFAHEVSNAVGTSARDGLQTVLFTDLAGSTTMQSRLGDAGAHEVVRAHDAAMRQAIGEFNGREVKQTGDGMMAAFGSAADAVSCALAVKRDIATYNDAHEGEELLVRFGLNAGEPIAEDDDLFGLSVTLAARIGDWGEPGQVLCSNVVRELLLGKGFEFTSVGNAELKGLDEPVPLYEVTE